AGIVIALLALGLTAVLAQPFAPGQGVLPSGNLLTTDPGGPYNFSLLNTQTTEVRAAIAFKKDLTDMDIIHFLTNVECLEGQFDTWGTFGHGFIDNLQLGGPTPIGARKAPLSEKYLSMMQEVALNEQGHALMTRHSGSANPCPVIDFDAGFNAWMAYAYGLPKGTTVADKFGKPFDPFLNDQNFILSVLSLEELGATGNKGLAGIVGNPVLSQAIAGLATSATAQATLERVMLFDLKDKIIEPFGETAQQVFARISAMRDSLDGPQFDDQGIVNSDSRTIAVPHDYANYIPTDIRGLTFARTPAQALNIIFLGDQSGKGTFFPEGIFGKDQHHPRASRAGPGTENFPHLAQEGTPGIHLPFTLQLSFQRSGAMTVAEFGDILPPITADGPKNVTGELDLTQSLAGVKADATADTRGLKPSPLGAPNFANLSHVTVAAPGRVSPGVKTHLDHAEL
ncbi:MAG: hypothetical protein FRX49_07396, partial [Trebouxia sp. A1-2]